MRNTVSAASAGRCVEAITLHFGSVSEMAKRKISEPHSFVCFDYETESRRACCFFITHPGRETGKRAANQSVLPEISFSLEAVFTSSATQ